MTTYDRSSGFASAEEAVRLRRGEDQRAVAHLGGQVCHLHFSDHQYGEPTDTSRLVRATEAVLTDLGARRVIAPLGLAHPDHVQARLVAAVLKAWNPDLDLTLYSDLPTRVLQPELEPEALGWWKNEGFEVESVFIGTSSLSQKEQAVRMYRSQLWALNLHAVLCPERFWVVAR